MRITCPRCDAEYQIPDAAIRTDGQDVQCSSCGHSWYLLPQVQQKATQAAPEETASPRAATKADRRADKLREVLDAHRNAILGNAPTEEDELIFDTAPRPRPDAPETHAMAEPPEAFSPRPSRALAPDVLSMLREEATRETKARGDGTGGAADKTDRPGTGGAATPAGAPTQSDATEPLPRKPEGNEPEATKPGSAEPEVVETEATAPDAEAMPPRPSQKMAPDMLSVLREEASRETEARRAPETLEGQPDLGLNEPPRGSGLESAGMRDRLARIQAAERDQTRPGWETGEETFPDPAALTATLAPQTSSPMGRGLRRPAAPFDAAKPAKGTAKSTAKPRKAGLPALAESRDLAVIAAEESRRGFRWGFAVPVTLSCAAIGLYLAAPWLADRVPGTAPMMESVTAQGDSLRTGIADRLRLALAAVTGS